MEQAILKIEKLTVRYGTGTNAVDDLSLVLEKGGSLGIMGESGSGKTTAALAVLGLLDKAAGAAGRICYQGIDLQALPEQERNSYRWRRIAMLFQNSLEVLNPVLTIDEQIGECLQRHTELTAKETRLKIDGLLESAGLDPAWKNRYPHQLSGGMRQRVLLAMALSCDPDILIADEPTSSLDAMAKGEILELLAQLQREKKFGLIVISHEIRTIVRLTSRLAVLYQGCVVEEGLTKDILQNPMHNYTRGLLNSSPDINPYRDLWGIPQEMTVDVRGGCPFYARCNQHCESCATEKPPLEYVALERKVACNRKGIVTLLQAAGINKTYDFQGTRQQVCDNCGLEIRSGEVVALIGQSGSGKTTLASILAGILDQDTGEILFQGKKVTGNNATRSKKGIQMVFQDPYSSINEHFSIQQAVQEPLDILGRAACTGDRRERVAEALKNVQLPWDEGFLTRKCHTLSGGQRQRVALARALVMEPALLIADEISSMLDPSSQANILRLLKGLQNLQGFAMLYITHDLAVAQKIADRIYVMHQGRIIEQGNTRDVFRNPVESYTKELVQEGMKALL